MKRLAGLVMVVLLSVCVLGQDVEPLLGIVRSQKEPFNLSCPLYHYADTTRAAVLPLSGCVATCIESLLTYYRYPAVVQDTLAGWTTDYYEVDTILPGTAIDWEDILPEYLDYTDEEAQAVADLTYWAGIGAKMTWTPTASGASMSSAAASLREHWGYGYVRLLSAVDYTPERWWELLDGELLAGRPVVYSGYTAIVQGHAFVVDGRDDEGQYHVCWGYGGQYDGWYDLRNANTYENPLYPTEVGKRLGHSINQEMIVLRPDSLEFETADTVADALAGLEVTDVAFVRSPDCNGYVEMSCRVKNTSDVSRQAVLLFITCGVDETECFTNGTTAGLAGAELEPGETQEVVTYLSFGASGEQLLGISTGDTVFVWQDTLSVEGASGKGVEIVGCEEVEIGCEEASFAVAIRNESETAWTGRLLTMSLFEGDYTEDEGDWRQWLVLNLAPGATERDTICFAGLSAGTDYTFVVRNTWLPAAQVAFRTAEATGVVTETRGEEAEQAGFYDLQGRRVPEGSRGIVLTKRNGRYIKIRND